jgi:hypothetical protein
MGDQRPINIAGLLSKGNPHVQVSTLASARKWSFVFSMNLSLSTRPHDRMSRSTRQPNHCPFAGRIRRPSVHHRDCPNDLVRELASLFSEQTNQAAREWFFSDRIIAESHSRIVSTSAMLTGAFVCSSKIHMSWLYLRPPSSEIRL